MIHIVNYVNKIEAIIAARENTSLKTKESKGLLAPSKPLPSKDVPKTSIDIIASMVQSIRQARKKTI